MNQILQKLSADDFMEDLYDVVEEQENEAPHTHNIGIKKAIILGGLATLPIAIIRNRPLIIKMIKGKI